MEIKESVVAITGIVGFSVVALVVATKQAPVPRIGDGSGSFLFQEPEQEHSEAGAPPLELPPHAVEDVETSLLQAESPASGAGLHLSPAGESSSVPPVTAVDRSTSAGDFFTSPDYAPSRERFLELSAAIYCALDLTIEELQDVDAWFWESNPEYAYLLNQKPEETLRSYFQIEDPRLALERQWTEEGTLPLWREHMRLFKQQHLGHVTGAELSLTRARLFAARDAIWSGVSPAHQFLFRLDQETR